MPSVGSHSPQSKFSNTWKAWTNFWAKHNGSWKKPLGVYVKQNGNWVKVWDERPTVSSVSTYFYFNNPFYYNIKNFNFATNGFATSIYVDGGFQETVAADTTAYRSYGKASYYPYDYPTITLTNASGSVTF